MGTTIDGRFEALASRQHGLVTRRQLLELGLTPRRIEGWLAARRLHRVHDGVYRLGAIVTPQSRLMAAVLACGRGAAVSHSDAAWILELGVPSSGHGPVHVKVDAKVRVRRPGIIAHRALGLTAADVTVVDHIPVTVLDLTLLDLAAMIPARILERVVAEALRGKRVTMAALEARLAASPRRPGASTLKAVLGQNGGPAFLRSELEALFNRGRLLHGLPPPLHNTREAGWELDMYWPHARFAVELDGAAYHSGWRAQELDRARDADLAAAGIQVVRVTWKHLVDHPEKTMTRVAQALAIATDRVARQGGR
jgi:hypothetical protein